MSELDYRRIEKAIRYLQTNYRRQPELAEVAAAVGLSEYHFHRLFRRWAGITPKRFAQYLTAEHAIRLLRDSQTVLDAAYDAGLSGAGRLHDLLVNVEAMTPGEIRRGGAGLAIRYGYHRSPFGECLIATTERGICGLSFVVDGDRAAALAELRGRWPAAVLLEDARATREIAERAFNAAGGAGAPLALHLRGTNFQIRVWEALLRIPEGAVVTYADVAARIGQPTSARATGTAIGRNPIAFLIPCHRVIRGDGMLGGYHWDPARKVAILAWEAGREMRERGGLRPEAGAA